MGVSVKKLTLYPVKSMAGMDVETAFCDGDGLKGDRRFVIVNDKNKFITAREVPRLLRLMPKWDADFETLTISGFGEDIILSAHQGETTDAVTVWNDTVTAGDCGDLAAEWISEYLGKSARIKSVGTNGSRSSEVTEDVPRSFADLMPLLLLSQQSVDMINEHLDAPISATNFRPNILLDGTDKGFAEDLWQTVKIGDVSIDHVLACSRCIMTTADPETGMFRMDKEPMRTLGGFRRGRDKQIYVGQNGVPRSSGMITVGDSVKITEHRQDNIFACDYKG